MIILITITIIKNPEAYLGILSVRFSSVEGNDGVVTVYQNFHLKA
jgi:hypothetical protein